MVTEGSACAAELPDPTSLSRIQCAEHKRLQREYIQGLAEQSGVQNPAELASELNLLVEGAIVNAHVERDFDAAQGAKRIARALLNEAL